MYVIRLKIKQTEYFNGLCEKRFALINRCHNILVRRSMHLLNRLKHDRQYQQLLDTYHSLDPGSKEARETGRQMNEYRKALGLSKSGLESYIKVWQKRYSGHISSHQAQKEAERVMAGVEKVLFGNGKELHFRKLSQATTLCSKSPSNGVSFDRKNMTFRWMKDTFSLKPVDKDDIYMINALYPDGNGPLPVSYCEIKRMMFPNGWHYYLNVYVKGTAPRKHMAGTGRAGIDPGTSTMAVYAEHKVMLRKLAPEAEKYTTLLKEVLRAMDKSRRASNPDNYDPEGRVIKGRRTWRRSARYRELERKFRSLCRRKALYIRQSHCILANEVLRNANEIIVEHMDYHSLQRKAKNTERQDRNSVIQDRKGRSKVIHKYKRKKRFGRSLGSRAPSEFLAILKQKAEASGGIYNEIDTKTFRASQYGHSEDTYTKTALNERFKTIGGIEVQRDLYSAFLIQHSNDRYDSPDRQACITDFAAFAVMHDKEIKHLKETGQSRPCCFGF
ncbi:MAG: hypothetical protein HUJ76_09145 [Parasporobacterium sp.]|nr:hypothetical protein [Parasporobacterium sp.]